MNKNTRMFHVRVTDEEYDRFLKTTHKRGITRGRVLRKLVRDYINADPDLLPDDLMIARLTLRQLTGMANNLNQIAYAMNAGLIQRTVDQTYLDNTQLYIANVKKTFETYIHKTRSRWVDR